jgi:hypothetical protein
MEQYLLESPFLLNTIKAFGIGYLAIFSIHSLLLLSQYLSDKYNSTGKSLIEEYEEKHRLTSSTYDDETPPPIPTETNNNNNKKDNK